MNATTNDIDVAAIVAGAVNDVTVTRIKRGSATKLLVNNLVKDGVYAAKDSVIGGKRAERNNYVVVAGFISADGLLQVIVDCTRMTLKAAQSRANSRSPGLAGWWFDKGPQHVTARVVKVSA